MARMGKAVSWKRFPEEKPVHWRSYCVCVEDGDYGDTRFDTAAWFQTKWMKNGHDISSEVVFWLDSEPLRREVVL